MRLRLPTSIHPSSSGGSSSSRSSTRALAFEPLLEGDIAFAIEINSSSKVSK
jgi:hypothetical protein